MTIFNFAYPAWGYLSLYGANSLLSLGNCISKTAVLIFYVIILDALLCIIFRETRLKNFCQKILLIISACIFICELFTIYYYHSYIDSAMMYVALGTKPYEIKEYFDVYVADKGFFAFLVLIAAVIFILRFVYMFISRFKIFWGLALFSAALFSARWIYYGNFFNFKHVSIMRLPVMMHAIYLDNIEFEKILNGARHDAILTRNESSIPYFVFILGESTTRNHMSLYGYHLETNPRLAKRDLYIFQDVVSPHSHTIPVMEKLFTFYRYGAEGRWFNYANLFNILNAAGYNTVWLSNQETFGIYSTAGRFYAKQGKLSKFAMARSSDQEFAYYDEKILPILDDTLLNNKNNKNFFVMHLMGTHSRYDFRYPAVQEFEKFSYKDERGYDGISNSQREIRAKYDNAVLYNDFIVDEIIKRFEDKNAIVIYVSDHGEEVYDMRAEASHEEQNVSRFMIEIPMLIWTSREFAASYPDLCKRFAASVNRPFMTDDMIHVILDIMDIATDDYDASKSIINENFDASRRRICSGKIYDKENGI